MGFFRTWKEVMFNPVEFFEKLPGKIGYKEPSLFYLKLQLLVSAILMLFLLLILGVITSRITNTNLMPFGLSISAFIFMILIMLLPLSIIFSYGLLFVNSAIIHLFVKLFEGKREYKETFKVSAYSSAPLLFMIIPLVNYIALAYLLILQIIGIHKQHKISVAKSAVAVLVPPVLYGLFMFILYFIFIFSAMKGA